MKDRTTEELVKMLIEAKQVEKSVTDTRQKIADELTMRLEWPVDGSKSHTIGDHKVTIKGVVNYKVDWEKFDQVIKGREHPPFKFKKELDVTGFKWIRDNDKSFYKQLCEAVTTSSGRTQVQVEEIEQ